MAPVVELQRALTVFLVSQPALAKLPATTLKHISFLVSVSSCPHTVSVVLAYGTIYIQELVEG